MRRAILLACSLLVGLWAQAIPPDRLQRWFDKPKSPRIANYRIAATLDWPAKTLEGRETLTWRNSGTAPTAELPLHLYLNAFKGPQSIYMRETGTLPDPEDRAAWGYCRLRSVEMEGRRLDGHSGEDETVYWVALPRAVAPGETIHLEVAWETRFPRVLDRSGYSRSGLFLMAGQWFPKVGVYGGDRWTCAAHHGTTEFFADFGTYDVELSMPNRLLLASTGNIVSQGANDARPDPRNPLNIIWTMHAEDVHDFAWAVMPSGEWSFRKTEYRGIEVYYFYQPQNYAQLDRQRFAVQGALKSAGEWYFPYPYPILTVIEVPLDAPQAGGMEYPTLFTTTSSAFDPIRLRLVPEQVSIHEFGHQYFQGMLASNEVEEPWLDEGVTSWFTHKTMERLYQNLLSSRRFQAGTEFGEWVDYWRNPQGDPIVRAGYRAIRGGYGTMAYSKPTLVLNQLEAMLGRPVMEEAMRAYAAEWAFRHPTGRDLRRVLERVSGRDLGAFWRDYVEGTEVLDYAIGPVRADGVLRGGWTETPRDMAFVPAVSVGTRGSITLLRRGGIRAPLTLWVRLEDKRELRVTWDGEDRWATFTFDAPVEAAVLDPDGNYPLLKDRLHASYVRRPVRRGFHYWSQLVWGTVTGLLQGIGLG
jgi:hypothetical protein